MPSGLDIGGLLSTGLNAIMPGAGSLLGGMLGGIGGSTPAAAAPAAATTPAATTTTPSHADHSHNIHLGTGSLPAHHAAASGHVTVDGAGHPVLTPTQATALHHVATLAAQAPVRRHQEQAARSQVRRIQDTVTPHLEAIRAHQTARANQIAATAEHRQILLERRRQARIVNLLEQIKSRMDRYNRRF